MGVAEDHRDAGRVRRSLWGKRVVRQGTAVVDRTVVVPGMKSADQSLHRDLARIAKAVEGRGCKFKRLQNLLCCGRGVLGSRGGELLAAHGHDAMEEACGCGHRHQGRALGSSARLAEDEDAGGVSAEGGDVVANPFERKDEIELSCVAGVAKKVAQGRRGEFREVKVAEQIEAMVESDDDRISTTGEPNAIVDRPIGGAGGVGSAVDVDQNRAFAVIEGRSPDVEVEAVFAVDRVGFVERSEGGATLPHVNRLRGLGTEGETIADTCPWLRSDRLSKPGARSVGTIRNSFEDENVLIDETPHPAGVC
jgi:hypothetical protein